MSLSVKLGLASDSPEGKHIEGLFKVYFSHTHARELNPEFCLSELLTFTAQLEKNARKRALRTTQQDYPDGRVLLTKALVYLIETYGLDKNYRVNRHALGILRDYRILNHAYENKHQLIYEINRIVKNKKDAIKAAKKTEEVRKFLVDHLKTLEGIKEKTTSLSRFLYFVDHPVDEQQMQKVLQDLLDDLQGNPDLNILHAYMYGGKNKWYFLNTVYEYYRKQNPEGVEDFFDRLEAKKKKYQASNIQKDILKTQAIDDIIQELILVDETHARMRKKTKRQAMGMMFGGFAFGMEIAMLALENLALMTALGPWGVLGISFAACVILGTPIAKYFHSAHYEELEKHNQYEYFHRKSHIKSVEDGNRYGRFIAKLGTVEEGAAAACLLLTLGAFMAFDMVSWGIKGGEYNSALPGLFFSTVSNSVVFYVGAAVAGLVLLAACVWVASCLASAHYALDGKHTIEYYDKKREEANMRGAINLETSEPLYFSKKLEWRHKIDKFFEPEPLALQSEKFQPIF